MVYNSFLSNRFKFRRKRFNTEINIKEMNIGIITFHRAHNYGAVLQCYALSQVLKGMGNHVEGNKLY